MARPKKTQTSAKSVAKKPTAKVSTKIKGLDGTIKLLAGKRAPNGATTKRPPNNPDMPQLTINHLNDMKNILDNYSQHLRALDRRRLNGVGYALRSFADRNGFNAASRRLTASEN